MKINKKKIIVLSSIFLVVAVGVFVYRNYIAKAATYGWIQTTWSSLTANTAQHTTDQTGWTQYSAVDSNVATGDSVSITSEITSLSQSSSTEFATGTSQGTLTTGDQVSLDLP
ncbi:MAG: hypothetical protein US30_C0002G0064 [Candidatus Moranbacteria bacterium GW2011_GWF2_36_839]|nr:MAG: hypothetical protein US27_C0003G0064 [Candidatus Moranbacteria bacterium GW2011_GWF1_36_78]KKQ17604.1 MAG: hypothetical protein US30_C0002G0064 [Candidatus Moranbacteria bacterium GW2011_GWF2_36_839]HAT74330.1 hypothetical protein [Candidatus Moranbacteria bacterium]HBY10892.1 hypothetical protein [Candidatus Moranbacteria bacterium]